MDVRVFGQVLQKKYEIKWELETPIEEVLERAEEFVKEYLMKIDDVELNDKTIVRGKNKCTVIETLYDADKQEFQCYTDYVVKIVEANKTEREDKIKELKDRCRDMIERNEKIREYNKQDKPKWYQFWK